MPRPSRMLPRRADRTFGDTLRASQGATLRTAICHIPLFRGSNQQDVTWDSINASSVNSLGPGVIQVHYRHVTIPCRIRWDDENVLTSTANAGIFLKRDCSLFVDPSYASWVSQTVGDPYAYLTIDGQSMVVVAGAMRQGFSTEGESIFALDQFTVPTNIEIV